MSKPNSLSTEKLVVRGLGEELAGRGEDGDSNPLYGYMGNPEYLKEPDVETGLADPR